MTDPELMEAKCKHDMIWFTCPVCMMSNEELATNIRMMAIGFREAEMTGLFLLLDIVADRLEAFGDST